MEIDFKGAARIDDLLTVETERGKLKGLRLSFNQRIWRDETLLLSALVTVVLITPDGKPRRFPKPLLEKLGVT